MAAFGVDPWRRIDFYVRHRLVPRAPTVRQLRQASKLNAYTGGGMERVLYYVRHPVDLLPTPRKRQALARMKRRDAMGGVAAQQSPMLEVPSSKDAGALEPLADRWLEKACQFSPVRFAIACYFNPYGWPVPWDAAAGTGLTIPLKSLISHVLHTPHDFALWDLQIVHADDEGLDELERELVLAETSHRLTYRVYRAMVQKSAYYDHLRELIPRVRRFDYPPPPPPYGTLTTNLVVFLNHALTL